MKTVTNRTKRPLKIRLGGGKTLHLGPMKSGKIADQAAEEDSVRKLVEAGEIEIAGESGASVSSGSGSETVHEATHGHPPTTVVLPKGNR